MSRERAAAQAQAEEKEKEKEKEKQRAKDAAAAAAAPAAEEAGQKKNQEDPSATTHLDATSNNLHEKSFLFAGSVEDGLDDPDRGHPTTTPTTVLRPPRVSSYHAPDSSNAAAKPGVGSPPTAPHTNSNGNPAGTAAVLDKAEHMAEKSRRNGASEKDVPDRALATTVEGGDGGRGDEVVPASTASAAGGGGQQQQQGGAKENSNSTTLPVIGEAAESASGGSRTPPKRGR